MFVRLIKHYLEDAEFNYKSLWRVRIFVWSALILVILGFYLKHAWKRWNFMKEYPSKNVGFFNPWGILVEYLRTTKIKGINLNVYVFQVFAGLQELFKKENFFFMAIGFSPCLVITKAKAVEESIAGSKHMEKHWFYFLLHPWLGTGLLTSHGSKWKSRRKMLTPAFHFDILKDFLPVFNEQSQCLVQILEKDMEKPWIDIVKPITLCSLDIICETALGATIGAQKNSELEYVKAVSRSSENIINRIVNPLYLLDCFFFLSRDGSQFKKDIKLLHDFTRSVIANKKQKLLNSPQETKAGCKKRKALMDLLLEEHIENGILTEDDIREEVDTFAFEGHDTTSMGMSWALYLIGLYKDVQEKLYEEIVSVFGDDQERPVTTEDLKGLEYLERVLKESQRLYPSVPIIGRTLSEDTVLCGKNVPKDVGLVIVPYFLHRDETVFPNPEKFDPDRFLPENASERSPYAYIPFSAGPRNCIGQRFAVMEEKVIIANILRNFSLESLDPRDKILIAPEVILRAAVPLRIKLKSRKKLSP